MLLSFEARREVANGGRWSHTGGDGWRCVVVSWGCGVGGLVGGLYVDPLVYEAVGGG